MNANSGIALRHKLKIRLASGTGNRVGSANIENQRGVPRKQNREATGDFRGEQTRQSRKRHPGLKRERHGGEFPNSCAPARKIVTGALAIIASAPPPTASAA